MIWNLIKHIISRQFVIDIGKGKLLFFYNILFVLNQKKLWRKKLSRFKGIPRITKFISKILDRFITLNWPLYHPFPNFKKRTYLEKYKSQNINLKCFPNAQAKQQMEEKCKHFSDIFTVFFLTLTFFVCYDKFCKKQV
jgi:hypothetical protein